MSSQNRLTKLGFGDSDRDNIRDILQQRYQGSRYSFGYPACPNMQDQYTQLELLQTEKIGLFMDESEQVYPESQGDRRYLKDP